MHVGVPELALGDVGRAELPVLVGLVDPRQQALALLFLGQVQKHLDDARAIGMQMSFQVHDGPESAVPHRLVGSRIGQRFAAQDAAVHPHDQHLFVVRPVEDADATALGQVARGAPEEVMFKFQRTRMRKAEHLTALRVDARHHMANRAVLARCIHGLKHQQQGMPVRRVEQALLVAQPLDLVLQHLAVRLLRLAHRLDIRGP